MKTWKLVSGIISMVISVLILFQSCAINVLSAMADRNDVGGAIGVMFAFILLAAGIVSVATRKAEKTGSNIALIVLYGICALIGVYGSASFGDLKVWALWAEVCIIVAVFAWAKVRSEKRRQKKEESKNDSQ